VAKKTSGQQPLGGFHDHDACCSVHTFKEGGCKVLLPGSTKSAGTWICLSGTAYQDQHSFHKKLCDLLFAWEKASGKRVSAPLELKGGHVDVSHVQKQLQNGANLIDDLLKGLDVALTPVLVHQKITTAESRMLEREKVSFRGRKLPISRVRSEARVDQLRW
jgi:hypothetical protein